MHQTREPTVQIYKAPIEDYIKKYYMGISEDDEYGFLDFSPSRNLLESSYRKFSQVFLNYVKMVQNIEKSSFDVSFFENPCLCKIIHLYSCRCNSARFGAEMAKLENVVSRHISIENCPTIDLLQSILSQSVVQESYK